MSKQFARAHNIVDLSTEEIDSDLIFIQADVVIGYPHTMVKYHLQCAVKRSENLILDECFTYSPGSCLRLDQENTEYAFDPTLAYYDDVLSVSNAQPFVAQVTTRNTTYHEFPIALLGA